MLRTACLTTWGADPGPECFTHWGRMLPYTLGELDKVLPKGKPPSRRQTDIGRNCDLFRSMVSEVFRPRWAAILGAQGWSEAWLDHVRARTSPCSHPRACQTRSAGSIAKSCFRYWTLQYNPGRFSDIQRARNGQRWHGEYSYDFDPPSRRREGAQGLGLEASHDSCGRRIVARPRLSDSVSGPLTVMGLNIFTGGRNDPRLHRMPKTQPAKGTLLVRLRRSLSAPSLPAI